MEVIIINQTKSGSRDPVKVPLNYNDKIRDIINFIKVKFSISLSSNRIGIFFTNGNGKKVYLTNKEKTLSSYNFEENNELYVKDFGIQVDWRLVYIVEYLGPLFIFPFFFFFNISKNSSLIQNISLVMGIFHFTKRIYESIFVHKFSRDTMPIKNLFVNIIYYWILFGVCCGFTLFNDSYNENLRLFNISNLRLLFAVLFFYFEYKNYKCHIVQKTAKEESNGEYKILPGVEGFQYVSCANYFWEFLSWLMFSFFTGKWSFYLFTFAGLYIMTKWALEKHANFRNLFKEKYPKERKAIIPFIL